MARSAPQLLRLALLGVVLAVITHTRADPDLWGHVRFGQDALRAGALPSIDPYSFVSDRPWINHEWAAEIVMYIAYAAAGGPGLILLKVALMMATLALIAAALPGGMPLRVRDLLIGIALVGTVPQASHVRPQVFSLALFAALLFALASMRWAARPALRVLIVGIVLAIWANVHGGWIVGALALTLWGALDQLRHQPMRSRLATAAMMAVGITATLANPYGWGLWGFLRDTVGFGRDQITDWQPVAALGPAYVGIWVLVLSTALWACARGLSRGPVDLKRLAVVVMLGVGSFQVNRLLAFFAIAVTMLLGPYLMPAAATETTAAAPAAPERRFGPAAALAAAIALVLVSGSSVTAWTNARCIKMDAAMFPEPAVAALSAAQSLRGRMLTWFDWGEYAIWHFAPRVSVSLDGRRETVYSDAAVQQQFRFYFTPSDRHVVLESLHPDYIWLPARLDVTRELQADGWHVLYAGGQSVLLSKAANGAIVGSAPDDRSPRCFPGP